MERPVRPRAARAARAAVVLLASDAPTFLDAVGPLVAATGRVPALALAREESWLAVTRTQPGVVLCDCTSSSAHVRALVAEALARGLPLLLAHPEAATHALRAPAASGAQRVGWLPVPVTPEGVRAALDLLLAPALSLVPRRVVPRARRPLEARPETPDE